MDNYLQDNFLKAVENLNFRFPVARISEDTGYGTGIVSEYLNGKKRVSEKFAKLFCKTYNINYDDLLLPQKATPTGVDRVEEPGQRNYMYRDEIEAMHKEIKRRRFEHDVNNKPMPNLLMDIYDEMEQLRKRIDKLEGKA